MGYTDAVTTGGDDSGATILPLLLTIIFSGFMTKILMKVGVVTSKNFDAYTKVVSGMVGIFWASSMELHKSFGEIIDFIVLSIGGVLVAVVFWPFFYFGAQFAADKERD